MHAIHIGPDPRTIGGMQCVLRTIREYRIGADHISILPTWSSPSVVRNGALVARAAWAILAADRHSIVHVHLADRGAYLRDPPLAALARRRGLRVVISIHAGSFPTLARDRPALVRNALTPAHHVVCVAEDARAPAREAVGHDRVTVLPNPVAIDSESPPAGETGPVVLFASAVRYRKGVDTLVDAWRMLLEGGIEGSCRILGPIQDFVPPKLERFTVEGPVDPSTIPQQIRTARVVAHPSRCESVSMTLTQAAAARRPFAATRVGGTPQLAPSDDTLVPVGDAIALAMVMRRYLTDRCYASDMGERAQQLCMRTHAPEIIDAKLRAIYSVC